ncbi:MAG: hypothetical protein ACFHWZ_14885 [Phycisphaerales bacterium]
MTPSGAQTKTLFDYVQRNQNDERLHLQHRGLAAPIDEPSGGFITSGTNPTRYWVTRFEYDWRTPTYGTLQLPRNVLKAVLYPSAMQSYTPAGASQPTYTPHTTKGLVAAFNHNEDGRLTQERVREGWSPILDTDYEEGLDAYTQVRAITRPELDQQYLQGFGTSIVQALPTGEVLYDDSGAAESAVSYLYSLDPVSGYSIGSRIEAMATVQDPVPTSQNGPGGSSPADSTRSIVIFDESGEVEFVIDPSDSLTYYDRQPSTGRVTEITANADPSQFSLPSGLGAQINPYYTGFAGRFGDGGSLTTQIARDELGRITTVTAPGGLHSSIVRSLEPWDFTDPESATPHAYGYYTETVLPHAFEDGGGVQFAGAATRTWFKAGGTAIGSESYLVDPGSAADAGTGGVLEREAFRFSFGFSGGPVARSVTGLSDFGRVELTAVWPDLAAFDGPLSEAALQPESVRPRVSRFTHDYRGNLVESQSPDGSIQTVEYDGFDRPIAIALGTDTDPGMGNMVTVRQMWYDSDGTTTSGVGDGHLTLVRESPSDLASEDRDTEMRYDFRGRLVTVINPASPHAHFEYDNLDRTATAILFDESAGLPSGLTAPTSSARLSKVSFSYDSHGRQYRRSVAIDPTGASPDTIDEFVWFDASGRAIASQSPSAPKLKLRYDGLGRLTASYATADPNELNPTVSGSYADTFDSTAHAPNLFGDVVFEQSEYRFVSTGTVGLGQLDLVTNRSRLHGTPDTSTGAIGEGGIPSINSFTGYYYDSASRLVHTAEFGTNEHLSGLLTADSIAPTIDQAASPNLFASVPTSLSAELEHALITSTKFDSRGRVVETLTPWRTDSTPDTRTRSLVFYNDLGELVGTIENAKASSGDPAIAWNASTGRYAPVAGQGEYSSERSRAISFNRNSIGQVSQRMAWRDAMNAQVTSYEYDHDIAGAGLATDLAVNWLLRRVNHPDESSGEPDPSDPTLAEEFAYNRLGELTSKLDQNSTQHDFTRDQLGRVILDVASAILDPDIDTGVRALKYAFDSAGRLQKVSSHSGPIPDAANTLNAMQYTYDSLWRLVQLQQNPLGDIAPSATTGIVDIAYQDVAFDAASPFGTHNVSRASDLRYPLGAGRLTLPDCSDQHLRPRRCHRRHDLPRHRLPVEPGCLRDHTIRRRAAARPHLSGHHRLRRARARA